MTDLFISYSHTDRAFVQTLNSALLAQEFETWVDFDNIPLTTDWWQEIQRGIEAANTIIFVISPASLASTVCNLEIAHARQYNKRFIPIMLAEVDSVGGHLAGAFTQLDVVAREALGDRNITQLLAENENIITRHNWPLFTSEAVFDDSLTRLIEAIQTDYDHVRTHTTLLARARQWEARAQHPDFLLTGTELAEAGAWIADSEAAQRQPSPARLHQAYWQAGLARQRRLRRRRLGVGIAGVVAALVLGTVAALGLELLPEPVEPMNRVVNVAVADFAVQDSRGTHARDSGGAALATTMGSQVTQRVTEADLTDLVDVRAGGIPAVDETIATDARLEQLAHIRDTWGANVIIYGTVDASVEGRPRLVPRIYVDPSLLDAIELTGSQRFGTAIPVSLTQDEIGESVVLTQEFIPRVEALTYFLLGLGLYKEGFADVALEWLDLARQVPEWDDAEGKEIVYYWLAAAMETLDEIDMCPVELPEDAFLSRATCQIALYQHALALTNDRYVRAQMGVGIVYYDNAVTTHPAFGELVECTGFSQAVDAYDAALEALPAIAFDVINAPLIDLKLQHNRAQALAALVQYAGCEGDLAAALAALEETAAAYTTLPPSEDAAQLGASTAFQMGLMQLVNDDPAAALAAFETVETIITAQERYAPWHTLKYAAEVQSGRVHLQSGAPAIALDAFTTVIDAYPDPFDDAISTGDALRYRGDAHAMLGDTALAQADYCAALALDNIAPQTEATLVTLVADDDCTDG